MLLVLAILVSPGTRAQTSYPTTLETNYVFLPISSKGQFLWPGSYGARFEPNGFGGFFGLDFWIHGQPVYNYTIEANGIRKTNGNAWFSGPIVQNLNSASMVRARISGYPLAGLYFERNVSIRWSTGVITVADVFHNTGTAPFTNLATLDNTDPDQGVPLGLGFPTYNDVIDVRAARDLLFAAVDDVDNPPSQRGFTVAFARRADSNPYSVVGVNRSGLNNLLPFSVINDPFDPDGAFANVGINLASNLGSLNPGEVKSAVWYIVFGATTAEAINRFNTLVDPAAPSTSIVTPFISEPLCALPVHFEWIGSDLHVPHYQLEYQWRVDRGAWSEWSSARSTDLGGLADGNHFFEVRAQSGRSCGAIARWSQLWHRHQEPGHLECCRGSDFDMG